MYFDYYTNMVFPIVNEKHNRKPPNKYDTVLDTAHVILKIPSSISLQTHEWKRKCMKNAF